MVKIQSNFPSFHQLFCFTMNTWMTAVSFESATLALICMGSVPHLCNFKDADLYDNAGLIIRLLRQERWGFIGAFSCFYAVQVRSRVTTPVARSWICQDRVSGCTTEGFISELGLSLSHFSLDSFHNVTKHCPVKTQVRRDQTAQSLHILAPAQRCHKENAELKRMSYTAARHSGYLVKYFGTSKFLWLH